MTAIPPKSMTPAERLDEVAAILAAGALRVIARRQQKEANNINEQRTFGLDLSPDRSVHGENTDTGEHQ